MVIDIIILLIYYLIILQSILPNDIIFYTTGCYVNIKYIELFYIGILVIRKSHNISIS